MKLSKIIPLVLSCSYLADALQIESQTHQKGRALVARGPGKKPGGTSSSGGRKRPVPDSAGSSNDNESQGSTHGRADSPDHIASLRSKPKWSSYKAEVEEVGRRSASPRSRPPLNPRDDRPRIQLDHSRRMIKDLSTGRHGQSQAYHEDAYPHSKSRRHRAQSPKTHQEGRTEALSRTDGFDGTVIDEKKKNSHNFLDPDSDPSRSPDGRPHSRSRRKRGGYAYDPVHEEATSVRVDDPESHGEAARSSKQTSLQKKYPDYDLVTLDNNSKLPPRESRARPVKGPEHPDWPPPMVSTGRVDTSSSSYRESRRRADNVRRAEENTNADRREMMAYLAKRGELPPRSGRGGGSSGGSGRSKNRRSLNSITNTHPQKRDAITNINSDEGNTDTNSPQNEQTQYQEILRIFDDTQTNATNIVLPIVQDLVSNETSSQIYDIALSVMTIADPSLIVSGPYSNGMHAFDDMENHLYELLVYPNISASRLLSNSNNSTTNASLTSTDSEYLPDYNITDLPSWFKNNDTLYNGYMSVLAEHAFLIDLYQTAWQNASDALNQTTYLDDMALFGGYLDTNDTSLLPPSSGGVSDQDEMGQEKFLFEWFQTEMNGTVA